MSTRKKPPTEGSQLIAKDGLGDETVLADGGIVDIYHPSRLGYLAQYFAVGFMASGMPATIYGFFIGYLNVPAYVYATAGVITSIPWSFKFFFGMVNDCLPIGGRRRKPYMCIGWTFCFVMLLILSMQTLPDPYWCRGDDGEYITTVTNADGQKEAAEPCNEDAAKKGGHFAFLMMLASLGYVIADVAADGLTVEYARREPAAQRGRTQTTAYLVRTMGQIAAVSVVGFGMNGKEYNGSFDHGLSFNQVMLILAVPAALMVPISWIGIEELPKKGIGFKPYLQLCRGLLRRKAFFYVLLFQFLTNLISSITTTAGGLVKNYWAGVQNLQNQVFSVIGSGLFALGLWLVNKYLLNYSWRASAPHEPFEPRSSSSSLPAARTPPPTSPSRPNRPSHPPCLRPARAHPPVAHARACRMHVHGDVCTPTRAAPRRAVLAGTTILLNILDMPFTFLTIYNVVRNQYFYLGETVLYEVPSAANFVVATFIIVEMADEGNEGMVYGLLTTTANLGEPFGNAISNQLFGLFKPSLSDSANYISDSPTFRAVVGISFVVSYFMSFFSLLALPLLPNQKGEAQKRKREWPESDTYSYITIALVLVALLYSLTVNFLSLNESTMCLRIAGGEGCEEEEQQQQQSAAAAAAAGDAAALAAATSSAVASAAAKVAKAARLR